MLAGPTHFSLRAFLSGSQILLSPSGLQSQQCVLELGCLWACSPCPSNQPGLCLLSTQTPNSHHLPLLPGAPCRLTLGLFDRVSRGFCGHIHSRSALSTELGPEPATLKGRQRLGRWQDVLQIAPIKLPWKGHRWASRLSTFYWWARGKNCPSCGGLMLGLEESRMPVHLLVAAIGRPLESVLNCQGRR